MRSYCGLLRPSCACAQSVPICVLRVGVSTSVRSGNWMPLSAFVLPALSCIAYCERRQQYHLPLLRSLFLPLLLVVRLARVFTLPNNSCHETRARTRCHELRWSALCDVSLFLGAGCMLHISVDTGLYSQCFMALIRACLHWACCSLLCARRKLRCLVALPCWRRTII